MLAAMKTLELDLKKKKQFATKEARNRFQLGSVFETNAHPARIQSSFISTATDVSFALNLNLPFLLPTALLRVYCIGACMCVAAIHFQIHHPGNETIVFHFHMSYIVAVMIVALSHAAPIMLRCNTQ